MNDLISRQSAIDAVWDGTNMDIYTREVKEILEALPSAEPDAATCWGCNCPKMPDAEKIGKWIEDDDATVRGHCSICGWESHYYEDDVVGANFCPNCGAKMEE